ncbi:MAG TPA: TPM domain-containing protein [Candidatus Eremiobacteraceae bacterium]|nr:TPM domain-containing protein [Candidatus Eremiobacteraceae bacterium]
MNSAAGRLFWAAICACVLFGWPSPSAAGTAAPPPPSRWVTDTVGFLSPSARASVDAELQAYQQRTGHQVIVYIGNTTGDVPLEEFTVNAFAAWKVGRKSLDDGLVLFIFANDRKVRIEVGYGLEPVVTDAKSAEIIRNVIVPAIKAGDNDAAVSEGIAQILATIDGSPAPEAGGANAGYSDEQPAPSEQPSLGSLIFVGIALIVFLIIFIRSPAFALWLLFNLLSGGRGGGGFSGGGGSFSGGGGRSGGGGASGSW